MGVGEPYNNLQMGKSLLCFEESVMNRSRCHDLEPPGPGVPAWGPSASEGVEPRSGVSSLLRVVVPVTGLL